MCAPTDDDVLDAWGELNCMADWSVLSTVRINDLVNAARIVKARTNHDMAAWQAANATIQSLAPIASARA